MRSWSVEWCPQNQWFISSKWFCHFCGSEKLRFERLYLLKVNFCHCFGARMSAVGSLIEPRARQTLGSRSRIIYSEERLRLTNPKSLVYFHCMTDKHEAALFPSNTDNSSLSLPFLSLDLWGKASNKKHGWVFSAWRCCLDRCSFTSSPGESSLVRLWHHHRLKWWICERRIKASAQILL